MPDRGNPLKIRGQRFAAFGMVADGEPVPRERWPERVRAIGVPVLDLPYPTSIEQALTQVETLASAISPERIAEGVVWRAAEPFATLADRSWVRSSWKVLSARYLLKHDR